MLFLFQKMVKKSSSISYLSFSRGSVSGSVPPPDFPLIEFLLTEVVNQSQIDSPSISDMLQPRGTSNSSKEAFSSLDFQQKTRELATSDEEMRENRDLNVSPKPPQSTRDSSTIPISNNSTLRKSIPGTKTDKSPALPIDQWYEISSNKKGKDVNRDSMPRVT